MKKPRNYSKAPLFVGSNPKQRAALMSLGDPLKQSIGDYSKSVPVVNNAPSILDWSNNQRKPNGFAN